MENKYYTPDITDLFIGYELEYKNIMQENIFKPEVCEQDMLNIAYSIWEENDYIETFENHIRTKYLDKEDIEKLGWINKQYIKDSNIVFNFVKEDWYLEYWVGEIPYIEIGKEEYDLGYKGNCPSINELRKIMKYLGIK